MPVIVAALQLGLDAFCCWHIWKTGRPYWWMFVVIGFPVFGAVGYLLFEVLPSAGAHHHVKRVIKHFDPGADFRARLAEVERCGSIANKLALADECINIAQFDDAIRIYRGVLTSHGEDLPALFGLANAYFWKGDAPNAVDTLQQVVEREPVFASGEAKLMLARALAGAGRTREARDAYEALLQHYSGEEARAYYVAFLAQQGDRARAEAVMGEIDKRLRLGSHTYRRMNDSYRRDARKAYDAAFATA
jgi:hypothetical protein